MAVIGLGLPMGQPAFESWFSKQADDIESAGYWRGPLG